MGEHPWDHTPTNHPHPILKGEGSRGDIQHTPIIKHGARGAGHTWGSGYPMGPSPSPGIVALEICDAAIHAFVVVLEGVVSEGDRAALIYP